MFILTKRSASERKRLNTWLQVAILLPVCIVAVFAIQLTVFFSTGSRGPTPPRSSGQWVRVQLVEVDASIAAAVASVASSGWRVDADDIDLILEYRRVDESRYVGVFGSEPSVRRLSACTVDGFRPSNIVIYVDGLEAKLWEELERAFGADWRSLQNPDVRAKMLPAIEEAIANRESENLKGRFGQGYATFVPVVSSTISSNGVLVVEAQHPVNRWQVLPNPFGRAIAIWIGLSIGLFIQITVSRERKAQRWVAMKCPKCGYERQRDRTECPECGLVYERPSYVLWDPTEDAARENVRRDDT